MLYINAVSMATNLLNLLSSYCVNAENADRWTPSISMSPAGNNQYWILSMLRFSRKTAMPVLELTQLTF